MVKLLSSGIDMRFWRDVSLSAATAGFVAVLVGFTSSVAIVFQAALAFGATPAHTPQKQSNSIALARMVKARLSKKRNHRATISERSPNGGAAPTKNAPADGLPGRISWLFRKSAISFCRRPRGPC
jgi:hypothetical protein